MVILEIPEVQATEIVFVYQKVLFKYYVEIDEIYILHNGKEVLSIVDDVPLLHEVEVLLGYQKAIVLAELHTEIQTKRK
ncbi:hypothetical protein [Enterobacter kobei]|uniref:hypothetical protein n=1 Tax=Enterobacter kobei TaxID=208224 RepID=UPI0018A60819|nr:hypothetical protein [Enterobacter kobei]BBV85992.1 hypothetical protein STW0522ENT62_14380 [Enterobacter kobei]